MTALSGKKILLGITGSIAAYKCTHLVRLFVKQGAEVRVVMTTAATEFVSPLSLSTVSKQEVLIDLFSDNAWNNHVELGLWADLIIIAPATANTLSKMASGQADNMLLACYLSAKCPVLFAPAMDLDMWKHPSTSDNVAKLQSYGNQLIPVGKGELASGLKGEGRLAEPEEILEIVTKLLSTIRRLSGKKAIVTAGPTRESIDPVRFLSNPSSGRMGIAIAEALSAEGAEVELILGPSALSPSDGTIKCHNIVSAQDMYEACLKYHKDCDIAVFAAAVADYRPAKVSDQKIKKSSDNMALALERTVDIAATLGKTKKDQIHVGFALETQNGIENARSKRDRKNFDFVVLNSPSASGTGFGHKTNKVSIIEEGNKLTEYELKSKDAVAKDIVRHIIDKIASSS